MHAKRDTPGQRVVLRYGDMGLQKPQLYVTGVVCTASLKPVPQHAPGSYQGHV